MQEFKPVYVEDEPFEGFETEVTNGKGDDDDV